MNNKLFFFGHGSPQNIIGNNYINNSWKKLFINLEKPDLIISFSAHWETIGTYITSNDIQKTIYDFYGFEQDLYNIKYNPLGDLKTVNNIKNKLDILPSVNWGLDHGTWGILYNIFPKAEIPVLQISLDKQKTLLDHYNLALSLKYLREKNIMFMGSGNIIHNLGELTWGNKNFGYDWAIEINNYFKNAILNNDIEKLLSYENTLLNHKLAIPTKEHLIPLIYIMGLKDKSENIEFFNDFIEYGSISMTSFYTK